MKKTGIILLAVILLAAAFLPDTVRAEDAETLKPYSGETGYTYVTFGRYPQTITGGSPDDPKNTIRSIPTIRGRLKRNPFSGG